MFTTLAVAARDRKRLAEISGVAARFGLEAVLLRLGLGGGEAHADGPEPLSRRTRQALEALGPTFVKLGQILSTRSDLLPADWIAEFEQLQSAGPTLDFETLRPEVEAALGGPPEQVFARFDAAPWPPPPSPRCIAPPCTTGPRWWSRSAVPACARASRPTCA
ncbi:hypothetical protein [Brevundimonas diminuta]|uniref:hypothetical protein n=1 Tax=Brevundimonas diminuta TaxID=293 RepID=UPI003D9AAE42